MPEVEATILKLLALKFHPGPNMSEFLEWYKPEEKVFGDIKLAGICNPVDYNKQHDFQCSRFFIKKVLTSILKFKMTELTY